MISELDSLSFRALDRHQLECLGFRVNTKEDSSFPNRFHLSCLIWMVHCIRSLGLWFSSTSTTSTQTPSSVLVGPLNSDQLELQHLFHSVIEVLKHGSSHDSYGIETLVSLTCYRFPPVGGEQYNIVGVSPSKIDQSISSLTIQYPVGIKCTLILQGSDVC